MINVAIAILMFLYSLTSEQDHEENGTEDEQQSLIKGEQAHGKKTQTSQLVQEEKTETGNVCDEIQ